jgi:Ca2+-binding EF-hand superfamily protein
MAKQSWFWTLLLLTLVAPVMAQSSSRKGDRGSRGDRGNKSESQSNGQDAGPSMGPGGGGRFGGGGMFGGGMPPFLSGGGLADMVRRFDRNSNNMLEPNEIPGPAGFFLQRMAQNNPKIDLSKPIPIDLILSEVERMRNGMMGGGAPTGESVTEESASNEPQLLVPDFRLAITPLPIASFSDSAAVAKVAVTDLDRSEAEDRLRRYDRNNDGALTADEISGGRWSDDPMQYDRNRDGKLNVEELAVRQAERRVKKEAEANSGDSQNSSGGWGGGSTGWSRGRDPTSQGSSRNPDDKKDESKESDRFGDSKSYRISASTKSTDGLPDFFSSSDKDGDGQVTLNEFAGTLTEEKVAEFRRWDLNQDGMITAREAIAAARDSSQKIGDGPSSSSKSSSGKESSTKSASSSSKPSSSGKSGKFSEVDLEWSKRQIAKYDKNSDGALSKDEWEKMIVKPDGADKDRDGKITAEEYAAYRASK